MKPYFCSFLFFLVITLLLKNSHAINTSRNETVDISNPRNTIIIKAPAFIIVTDDVILKICYQMTSANRDFCRYTLENYRGKPLFPKPLANVMEAAQTHARKSTKRIWRMSDGIKDETVKKRYSKCLKRYRAASDLLSKASEFILAGKASSVRMYTSMAMEQIQSCDKKMTGYYGSYDVSEENKKFNDFANMIIAICSTVKPGKGYVDELI